MKKAKLKLLQICFALVLLLVLIYHAGLFNAQGRAELFNTLVNANPLWLVVSLLVGILINMASAFKWWLLTRTQTMGAGYFRVFAYYLVGQFYNQVLPTSVGGDVVRSYELGKFSGRQADSLASVFVERYTGILVLLLIAGVAVLAQLSRFNSTLIYLSLLAFALGLALMAWFIFDQRAYDLVRSFSVSKISKFEIIFSKLDKLLASIASFKNHPKAIALAFLNSFVFYFIAVINVYVTALAFNADVYFLDVAIATPIIMLLMNLPISLGNLFLMELSYSSVLALMGYNPALGLSVAIVMRLKSLFDGLLGGVLHPFFVTKKHK
ncbi:MAG: flippase-like domain-containing protein [Acidiferrobacterales bacterium]|nr:flippase-like domain-containing protein [Acidiferrobacterales bacterium]